MDTLVDANLKHKFLPHVVAEFPAITVGGAFAGSAGESISFKHGLFDAAMNWFEVVLGDGEVIHCLSTDKADLFEASKGAMGTLGVMTLFDFQFVPAQEWLEVDYVPRRSAKELAERILEYTQDPKITSS